jgi:hypothetical protein
MLETASQFARRANIERYRKILGTHLTAEERRFVQRRLTEEQALLHKLRGSVAAIDASLQRPTLRIDRDIP